MAHPRDGAGALNPELWQAVEELFAAALTRPPAERVVWVREQARDPAVAREVLSLLAAHNLPGLFDDLAERQDALERQESAPAGTVIGAWEIEGELGRGGMGVVYRARRADGEYEQEAALKILARDPPGTDASARFQAERQILARLSHPCIARLLDGGVSPDGRPYYVMELVPGQRIDEYCDGHDLDVTQRLRLFLQVCDAVQAAHRSQIVHRDIKPANVLVDRDGHPKLLDFGIAKPLEWRHVGVTPPQTRLGERVLTPEYAAPEQLRGEQVTPASDVYQLGMLLHELLLGRRPYEPSEATPDRIAAALSRLHALPPSHAAARITGALEGEVADTVRPRAATNPTFSGLSTPPIDSNLDDILLKALRLEPHRRYGTAGELAADVRRALEGRPVRAGGRTMPPVRYVLSGAAAMLVLATGVIVLRGSSSARDPTRAAPEASLDTPFEATVSRILWVDDDPGNNAAQIVRLRDLGIEVETSLSTADAMALFDPDRFQLVVSDMGRFEGPAGEYEARAGLHLLEQLRSAHPNVHVAFCTTNRAVTDHREAALAAGALAMYTNCDDILSLIGYPPAPKP